MGYGDFAENLKTAENGIRSSRKMLKKVYKCMQDGANLEAMEYLRNIDTELLNSLSDYREKRDGKFIDGKSKIEPNWIKNLKWLAKNDARK